MSIEQRPSAYLFVYRRGQRVERTNGDGKTGIYRIRVKARDKGKKMKSVQTRLSG